jgi:hypothetical protein
MSCLEDAALAQRDPALPALRLLLDPEALLQRLQSRLPAADLRSVRIGYVRYKPGTSCLAALRLDVAGVTLDAHAKAYREGQLEKLGKSARMPVPGTALGSEPVVLEREALVLGIFPADRELPGLPRLAVEAQRLRLLQRLFPHRPELWDGTLKTLAYKPERRYVGQWLVAGQPQAVLRFYATGAMPSGYAHLGGWARCGAFRVPRVLGKSSRRGALALEWMPGHTLSELLAGPRFDPGTLEAVGRALAELHLHGSQRSALGISASESISALAAADAARVLCPPLAAPALELAARLAARPAQRRPARCRIHGDFYASQVLLHEREVTFIDLDRSGRGEPASDLGNFLAHLEYDVLCGRLAQSLVEPVRDALLQGYAAGAGREPEGGDVAHATAAGLLRLLPAPFRRREPDWPQRMAQLLERAGQALQHGSRRPAALPGAPR